MTARLFVPDDQVALYISRHDLTHLGAASRGTHAGGVARALAAYRICRLWRLLRAERWINRVVNECKELHAFVTRLDCNYRPVAVHFGHGLRSLRKVRASKRLVRLESLPVCPYCEQRRVDVALYFAIGCGMARSTPYLRFACECCLNNDLRCCCAREGGSDYYNEPMTTWYDLSRRSLLARTKEESRGDLSTAPVSWNKVESKDLDHGMPPPPS